MPAPVPCRSAGDRPVEEGVAGAEGVEGVAGGRLGEAVRRGSRAARPAPLSSSRRRAPERRRAGGDLGRHADRSSATLIPMPSTAQDSPGRALDEDPRELAAVEQHVVGPLDAGRRPGEVGDREPGAQGEQRVCSRRRSEHRSAWPCGAVHVRPCRPRPAVCSPAVTSVPCGAPAAASARARSLVEPIYAHVDARPAERGHGSGTDRDGDLRARPQAAPAPPRRRRC